MVTGGAVGYRGWRGRHVAGGSALLERMRQGGRLCAAVCGQGVQLALGCRRRGLGSTGSEEMRLVGRALAHGNQLIGDLALRVPDGQPQQPISP